MIEKEFKANDISLRRLEHMVFRNTKIIVSLLFMLKMLILNAYAQTTNFNDQIQQSVGFQLQKTVSRYYLAIEHVRNNEYEKASKLISQTKNPHEQLGQQVLADYLDEKIGDKVVKEIFEGEYNIYLQKNYPEALKHYQKAIKIDPDYAISYMIIGTHYFNKGKDASSAIQALKKAVALAPNNALAHSKLATYYFANGEAELSYQHLMKSKELFLEENPPEQPEVKSE